MKDSVVTKLRRQVEKGSLANDVVIVYTLKGGTAEDGIDESVIVTAPGNLHVRVRDRLGTRPEGEALQEIGSGAAIDFLRSVLEGVENMIPASKARFVPDSLVASVTFAIGDEKETFYFSADEEESRHRGQPIKPEIQKMLERFRQVEADSLSGRGRGKEIK